MAASGINEHDEARRKERVIRKKAHYFTELQKNPSLQPPRPPTSYEQQLLMAQLPHSKESVDRQRRAQHNEDRAGDYSAKLNNRFSSKDYVAQW